MRTRIAPTLDGHGSAARERCAAAAAVTAATALWKTAKNASPSVETSTPPASSRAARRRAWWRSRSGPNAGPSAATRRVDPSMSVNRNVNVPTGRDTARDRDTWLAIRPAYGEASRERAPVRVRAILARPEGFEPPTY